MSFKVSDKIKSWASVIVVPVIVFLVLFTFFGCYMGSKKDVKISHPLTNQYNR